MNIKWIHSDGYTRRIYLDSDENFATSLAKMQNKMAEFDGDKYFYKDEDGDKIIVDDEETFVMMLEYFQNVLANKGRIHTYIRVDDSNKGENGSQLAGIRIDAHLDKGNILLHGINGINGPPITKNGNYSKWWNCWGIFE